MTRHDRRLCDMLIRVRNFGTTHGSLLPDSSTAHDAFARVAAEATRMEALDVAAQAAAEASRVATTVRPRRALTETLTRAAHTARLIASTSPSLEARVQFPLPSGELELLAVARQFAARASPYADQFAAHGITVPELEAQTTAFERALHQRKTARDEQTRLRGEMAAALAWALSAVATLDVSVVNALASNPVALVVWKRDRRIPFRRRNPTAASEPGASTAQRPALSSAEPAAVSTPPPVGITG